MNWKNQFNPEGVPLEEIKNDGEDKDLDSKNAAVLNVVDGK